MGRHDHGVRVHLWNKRFLRQFRRKQREWKRAGHYHYFPIQGGPRVTVHRVKWGVVVTDAKSPGMHPWIKHRRHGGRPLLFFTYPFSLSFDGRKKLMHVHGVPPILSLPFFAMDHPKGYVCNVQARGVEPATHKPGRGGAFRRGCWGAFIHFKLTSRFGPGLWPAWDPKHRTPVDPDT